MATQNIVDTDVTIDATSSLTISGSTNALKAVNNLSDVASVSASRVNILPALAGNAGKVLTVNGGATDVTFAATGAGTVTSVAVADSGAGEFTVGGSPIIAAGTITLAVASVASTKVTGLGTMSTQSASSVAITGGSVVGITDIAVTDGGTGASTPSGARTNLGLGDLAVENSPLALLKGGTGATTDATARANLGVTATGADTTYAFRANNLSDLSSAATARTNLGLGTMATQVASSVAITGGSITGITDIAVADGGTGSSTASGARTNLSAAASGANSDITGLSAVTSLSVGAGTAVTKILTATATLDFPNTPSQQQNDLTITVTGAATGDAVFLGPPSAPAAGIVFNAFVSAADTVTVRASNISAGAVNPASATYRAVVIHF